MHLEQLNKLIMTHGPIHKSLLATLYSCIYRTQKMMHLNLGHSASPLCVEQTCVLKTCSQRAMNQEFSDKNGITLGLCKMKDLPFQGSFFLPAVCFLPHIC